MRRLSSRLLMAVVGLSLLCFYLLIAAAGYQLLLVLWEQRPDPLRIGLYFLLATLVFGYLSYRLGTAGLLRELDTTEVPRDDAPWLHARIEDLCVEIDVSDVTLHVARMEAPNALAVGTARGGALVLDAGLFRLLSADELEAVIAHELAHLESRDGLIQTLGYTLIRTVGGVLYCVLLPVAFVVGGVLRALSWLRGDQPRPLRDHVVIVQFRVVQVIILVLFALTLVLRAHSRRRESRADDRAVEATGNPIALARALVKIERAATPGWGILSPLYIHGDQEGLLTRLLATHPAMDERVERLVRMADRMYVDRERRRRRRFRVGQ
jgi:heat shock protein HtpX